MHASYNCGGRLKIQIAVQDSCPKVDRGQTVGRLVGWPTRSVWAVGPARGSPFGSFSAKFAVAALAARHTRALSACETVGGGGGRGDRGPRLKRRQNLLAPVDGYRGSFGAKEPHLSASGVRILHMDEKNTKGERGRREGGKEGETD